jgi:hypothetical protein
MPAGLLRRTGAAAGGVTVRTTEHIQATHNMRGRSTDFRQSESTPGIRAGGVMQDAGYGLLRMPLLGAWVNMTIKKCRSPF